MRRRLSLVCVLFVTVTCLAQNSKTDKRILEIPDSSTRSVKKIGRYISSNFSSQAEQVRAIHIWVAKNIIYDVARMNSVNYFSDANQIIMEALSRHKGICTHYAFLFNALTREVGIKSYVAFGRTKQFERVDFLPHAWCVAKIDGSWSMFDPAWDAGELNSEGNFIPNLSDKYFKLSAEKFIKTHFPFDPLWQLLNKSWTYNDFSSNSSIGQGSIFNFLDSLTKYDAQSEISRLESAIQRMTLSDERDSLINDNIGQVRIQIENVKAKNFSDSFNEAVKTYNNGVARVNEFIKYRNNKFQPAKDDRSLKNMADRISNLIDSARLRLRDLKGYDIESNRRLGKISKSVSDLEKHFAPHLNFLERYLATPTKNRTALFLTN
jgi:hypothetical protein